MNYVYGNGSLHAALPHDSSSHRGNFKLAGNTDFQFHVCLVEL